MKHLSGSAQDSVAVPLEDCLAFLAAIEDYPNWYADVVTSVEMLGPDADGGGERAHTRLHLAYGPVSRDLDLLLAVRVSPPGLVRLSHVPRGPASGASFDATWNLEGGVGTKLGLELDATMPVPRLVPLGGVGDAFAGGFMRAAVAALEAGI